MSIFIIIINIIIAIYKKNNINSEKNSSSRDLKKDTLTTELLETGAVGLSFDWKL